MRSPPETTRPEPPVHLSEDSRDRYRYAVQTWDFTPLDRELLLAALENWDLYTVAMRRVREEGPVTVNPDSGNSRAHPGLAAAHASLRAYRQTLTHLDLELPEMPPRARGSRSRRT